MKDGNRHEVEFGADSSKTHTDQSLKKIGA